MNKILYNLALINAMNYCKTNNINCSGTYLVKTPRKFTYTLVKDNKHNTPVISTTYYKNQTPTTVVHYGNLKFN